MIKSVEVRLYDKQGKQWTAIMWPGERSGGVVFQERKKDQWICLMNAYPHEVIKFLREKGIDISHPVFEAFDKHD